MFGWGAAPLAAIAIALSPGVARAETCPSTVGGDAALATADATARYRFIEAELGRARRAGRIWNHAWSWGLAATAAGQVGIGLAVSDEDCPGCWYVGAGKAALGTLSTAVLNPVRIATPAPVDGAPSCEQLAAAEAALIASARSERVHWLRHAEGLAINLAATLYIGLELDEWRKGALSFASGLVVGELRLFTRPARATRALRRYRTGALGASAEPSVSWTVFPTFGRSSYGLGLALTF